MASDAARRFLLSVPLEPQLVLQAEGSPSQERRLLAAPVPYGESGSGREGKQGAAGRDANRRWACSLAATRDLWVP